MVSTYHAGSAAAALTRMLGAIEENPLFTSAIRLVQAQRLIRRLDDNSKEAYSPDDATLQWIRQSVDSLPEHVPKPNLDNLQLYRPVPTEDNPFGYTGQFAVRELLVMTNEVETELKKPIRLVTSRSIEAVAVSGGMTTLLQEGVLRVIAGETSVEEVMRILS
ncbi:MAG: ral secretion pathway protein [Patescibacteria group bacterium]|nr:ral secretion pathway protein [Patescibacteria group bacterium]